jgi:hypothetical protein
VDKGTESKRLLKKGKRRSKWSIPKTISEDSEAFPEAFPETFQNYC